MLFLLYNFQIGILKRRRVCLNVCERRLDRFQRCVNRFSIKWEPEPWRLCKWELEMCEFSAQPIAILSINQQIFLDELSLDLRWRATSNDLPFIHHTDTICLFSLF